jgi:hypothetical protein
MNYLLSAQRVKSSGFWSDRLLWAVLAGLSIQIALCWGSLDEWFQISMFCTGTDDPRWEWLGFVHLAYFGLFLLGGVALGWRGLRIAYLVLLPLSLLALPVQVALLDRGIFYCDGP